MASWTSVVRFCDCYFPPSVLLKVIGVDKGRYNIATDSGDHRVPRTTAEGISK